MTNGNPAGDFHFFLNSDYRPSLAIKRSMGATRLPEYCWRKSKFLEAKAVLEEIDLLGSRTLRTDSIIAMKAHALRGMLRAARKDCAAALNDSVRRNG